MGALVGTQVYLPIRDSLVLRANLWLGRGEFALADVQAACESLTSAEALARIRGQWDLGAEFAAAIVRCRTRRLEAERSAREAAERRLWPEAELIRNRAAVLKLLAGVGTRVGKDRRSPPEKASGQVEVTTEEGQAETEGHPEEGV